MFSSIDLAILRLKDSQPVIIVDSEDRENEGDLIFPAQIIDHKIVNFMITHCKGVVCMCITKKKADKLNLHLIPKRNYPDGSNVANFTLSIEAATGITTGISAMDRAHTIRIASQEDASAADISIPGHIFPIIGESGGLLVRQGHTEASMSLVKIAGFLPSSVICEIAKDDGEMAKLDDLLIFSKRFNIPVVTIDEIIKFMKHHAIDFAL